MPNLHQKLLVAVDKERRCANRVNSIADLHETREATTQVESQRQSAEPSLARSETGEIR